jgi:hypothetical protein
MGACDVPTSDVPPDDVPAGVTPGGAHVTRPYLLRRLRKQGWELQRSELRADGGLERDVLYGPGGDRRHGGNQLTVLYGGAVAPQQLRIVGRDEQGRLSAEQLVCASGRFLLDVADSGLGCR